MGKNHFQSLFRSNPGVNIAEIIRQALLYPRFVDEEGNKYLFVEVGMEELKETLHGCQKDKIMGLNGWTIEFYLGFSDLIGPELL